MSFFSVMWSFELGLMSLNQQRVKWTVALYLTLFSFCLSSLLLSGGVGSPCRGGEADGGAPEWGEASRGKNKVRSERGQEASSLIPFPIVPSVSSVIKNISLFSFLHTVGCFTERLSKIVPNYYHTLYYDSWISTENECSALRVPVPEWL